MLSHQIDNPLIENYLSDHFENDTQKMSLFVSDFIEKELIKKEIKIAFDELEIAITKKGDRKSLQDLIEEIAPE